MFTIEPTKYHLEAQCCSEMFEDNGWALKCNASSHLGLVRAIYEKQQLTLRDFPGLYTFADWLPVERILEGSGAPITFKSGALGAKLGLKNLYITFNGYWPEINANMKTGSFKECEAYSVCARKHNFGNHVMVVASAGNTARAFARVCSENNIPLLLVVPQDNLNALWFDAPINNCVKLVCVEKGADYFDAIYLSDIISRAEGFFPEGGAKNVARRDGMGTTFLSAATTIGRIPDYYFQAVGSGTGAIAAWEANLRLIGDGRFGNHKAKLMLSQNMPFAPMADAWDANQRALFPYEDGKARADAAEICAKVLSNRRPPWSIAGGLYDAMSDAGGKIYRVDNGRATIAGSMFELLEDNDISEASAVALASLILAVKNNDVEPDAVIMLNITGGGMERFKSEHTLHYLKPSLVFPIKFDENSVVESVSKLFKG